MENLKQACEDVAIVALDNYDTHKYDSSFTLWGICYHWPAKTPEWKGVIPALFKHAQREGENIIKPSFLIPHSSNPISHYSLLAMRNPSPLVSSFFSCLEREDSSLQDILLDRRLLSEAATSYVETSPILPVRTDFFDFLQNTTTSEHTQKKYLPLLERLFFRFESSTNLFKECSHLLPSKQYQALSIVHERALKAKAIEIIPELAIAHHAYAKRLQEQPLLHTPPPLECSPRSIFGKIRVKTAQGTSGFIDWEAYAKQGAQQHKTSFDPNEVLRQQLVNLIIKETLPIYTSSPEQAYRLLEERARKTGDEERKALNRVRKLFQYMESFDNDNTIHHTINIGRKA